MGNDETKAEVQNDGSTASEFVVDVALTLTTPDAESVRAVLGVREGQHTDEAIWNFCKEWEIDGAAALNLKARLDSAANTRGRGDVVAAPVEASAAQVKKFHSHFARGKFEKAVRLGLSLQGSAEQQSAIENQISAALVGERSLARALKALGREGAGADGLTTEERDNSTTVEACEEAIPHLEQVVAKSPKFSAAYLAIAKCQALAANYSLSLKSCSEALSSSSSRGSWLPDQARTKAAILSAKVALELGDPNAAAKRLAVALRADPECTAVKPMHQSLKQLRKALKKANYDLEKGYSHRALDGYTEVQNVIRRLDVKSGVLRGRVLLEVCKATSRIKRHEKAIDICDEAIELTNVTLDGLFSDPAKLSSAFIARAEALAADHDYAEAVRDFRRAVDVLSEGGVGESLLTKHRWGSVGCSRRLHGGTSSATMPRY